MNTMDVAKKLGDITHEFGEAVNKVGLECKGDVTPEEFTKMLNGCLIQLMRSIFGHENMEAQLVVLKDMHQWDVKENKY